MTNTLITDRVLVTDHSLWDPILKPQELIDGGVTDVILKGGSGMRVDPQFLKNGALVAKFSSHLRLHMYWWDDPIFSAGNQADFAVQTVRSSGLPIRSIWADMEQWWSNWDKWTLAVRKIIPWSEVPVIPAWALDTHYRVFAESMLRLWPAFGIYCGRGFITSWAPGMSKWLGRYKIWEAYYANQPAKATKMSWQEFKSQWLPNYDPDLRNTGFKPENLVGHQFTGDRCLLPGAYQDILGTRKAMDVSVFRRDFMESVGEWEIPEPAEPIPPQADEYIFQGYYLKVFTGAGDNYKQLPGLSNDQRVRVLEIKGTWARLDNPAGWCRLSWLTKL